jgi:hypothetical protein
MIKETSLTNLPSDEFLGNAPLISTGWYVGWYNPTVYATSSLITDIWAPESIRAVTAVFPIVKWNGPTTTFLPGYFVKGLELSEVCSIRWFTYVSETLIVNLTIIHDLGCQIISATIRQCSWSWWIVTATISPERRWYIFSVLIILWRHWQIISVTIIQNYSWLIVSTAINLCHWTWWIVLATISQECRWWILQETISQERRWWILQATIRQEHRW